MIVNCGNVKIYTTQPMKVEEHNSSTYLGCHMITIGWFPLVVELPCDQDTQVSGISDQDSGIFSCETII